MKNNDALATALDTCLHASIASQDTEALVKAKYAFLTALSICKSSELEVYFIELKKLESYYISLIKQQVPRRDSSNDVVDYS